MIKLTQDNERKGIVHKCGFCGGNGKIHIGELTSFLTKKCPACNGKGYTVEQKIVNNIIY